MSDSSWLAISPLRLISSGCMRMLFNTSMPPGRIDCIASTVAGPQMSSTKSTGLPRISESLFECWLRSVKSDLPGLDWWAMITTEDPSSFRREGTTFCNLESSRNLPLTGSIGRFRSPRNRTLRPSSRTWSSPRTLVTYPRRATWF